MPVPNRQETETFFGEGPNFYIDRDFLILDEAAIDVQSHFRLAASRSIGDVQLVDKWMLSGYRLGKQSQFVISATEIREVTDSAEKMQVRAANNGLSFCSRHGIIRSMDQFKETPHLLEIAHELGDYTVIPDGNLYESDQILVRTIGFDLFPDYRGRDIVLQTSFSGIDEPHIRIKMAKRVLAWHRIAGSTGSLAESIDLALVQGEISPDFANAFGLRATELAFKKEAERVGINPGITDVIFNFRDNSGGGSSMCCKP